MNIYYLKELHEFNIEDKADHRDDGQEGEKQGELIGGSLNAIGVQFSFIQLNICGCRLWNIAIAIHHVLRIYDVNIVIGIGCPWRKDDLNSLRVDYDNLICWSG